jgi:hypothetical protein
MPASEKPTPISIYAGAEIALLTQHGKQRVIAPVLEDTLGCRVRHVDSYDTDLLGTFTRDIPRFGTQVEVARKKARLAMELAGLPFGLGSEGAFVPDPFLGMASWNVEVIVFIDYPRNLEVVGMAENRGNFHHLLTHDWPALEAFAREVGFPEQQLVVRPRDEHDRRIRKGIQTWPELEAAWAWAVSAADNGLAFVETDGRAHANPARMANIAVAAADLAARLASRCPACGTPGYWRVERVAGLPCADCGAPTRETRAWVYGCLKCTQRETRPLSGPSHADPGRCDVCNP